MHAIKVLDTDVANQIAAGEVIERPASVVKELVENAIDAGATSIVIEVRGAGKELIRVKDDGRGIPADQAELAFVRHATSKIRATGDLACVQTLGFRGEALPSIASVAKVELISRSADAEAAVKLEVEGEKVTRSVFGAPIGTQVTVRDLFYNTPARYKFLKTDATERRTIAEFVTHIALAQPSVAVWLKLEGKDLLKTPGSGNLKDTILSVYGKEVYGKLISVEWDSPTARVSGYIGDPSLAKGNRSRESTFVNGRWVQSHRLTTAIEKGYESLLAHRRYPLAVLHLEIDPAEVDVNVHPAKAEIRLKNEREVFATLMRAVRKALTESNLVPDVGELYRGAPAPVSSPGSHSGSSHIGDQARITWEWGKTHVHEPKTAYAHETANETPLAVPRFEASFQPAVEWQEPSKSQISAPRPPLIQDEPESPSHAGLPLRTEEAKRKKDEWRQDLIKTGHDPRETLLQAKVLGQIANTYIVMPAPSGLWLIDQHVAHERILYEEVLARGNSAGIVAQELLTPLSIEMPAEHATAIMECWEELRAMGFVIESFGGRDFLVRAVPAELAGRIEDNLTQIIEELVWVMDEGGPTMQERAAAAVACRAAIKAGEPLQTKEMEQLVRRLASVENPFACPHGRPVVIQMSLTEIERRFGRR